jgi:adenine C2-methylase RlmN of 23S rRNA A2503 and tRNA A37
MPCPRKTTWARASSKQTISFDIREVIKMNKIQKQLEEAGYANAVAVATEAEIQAGAACGQLAIVVEE